MQELQQPACPLKEGIIKDLKHLLFPILMFAIALFLLLVVTDKIKLLEY
jgi:hypothetical protein